jgi:hypothetical protein
MVASFAEQVMLVQGRSNSRFSRYSGWRQRVVSWLCDNLLSLCLLRENASQTQAGDANEIQVTCRSYFWVVGMRTVSRAPSRGPSC